MDDFKPNNAARDATVILPAVPEQSDELKANLELAKAASDAKFILIVGKQIKWNLDRASTPAKIENDEQYSQAVAVAGDMKSTLKSLEEIRLSYVAFPTKVVAMVNGLFRDTKKLIEEHRTFLKRLVAVHDNEKERVRQAELAKAVELNVPAVVEQTDDEVGKVKFAELPATGERAYVAAGDGAENSVDSTKGAVEARSVVVQDFNIVVEDVVEFLRVLVSRADGKIWITEHASEIVKIDFEALKSVLRENPAKRKVKGLRIAKV